MRAPNNITRQINRIVLHCTATSQQATVEAIQNYWKNNLGWKNPGYHFIIGVDGTVYMLLHPNKVSNGARGYNSDSLHISYIGGINKNTRKPEDTRTKEQKAAMKRLVKQYLRKLGDIPVIGHNEISNKACPSFDVQQWLKDERIKK